MSFMIDDDDPRPEIVESLIEDLKYNLDLFTETDLQRVLGIIKAEQECRKLQDIRRFFDKFKKDDDNTEWSEC